MHGDITYNGSGLEEFVPQRTAAYVSQVRACFLFWLESGLTGPYLKLQQDPYDTYIAMLTEYSATCTGAWTETA